ncbi:MAG: molybdate ABC transporter substrate-binding protein [Actinomycetota bacterium]
MHRTLISLVVLTLAACGGDDDAPAADARSGSINVFAAASLAGAFTALGEQFEAAHPDADIVEHLNFAASSELVTQIDEGAPADVFASADAANMDKIVAAGANAAPPTTFARNRLAIAVERGNPLGIATLADLANRDVKVVLCAETVPCGKLADEVLANAGVKVTPVSREANVKDTLGKVGEADAAIVYVTDVKASDAVEGIEIPNEHNVIAALRIAPLTHSGNSTLATAWVEYVTSPEAVRILTEEFGFLEP